MLAKSTCHPHVLINNDSQAGHANNRFRHHSSAHLLDSSAPHLCPQSCWLSQHVILMSSSTTIPKQAMRTTAFEITAQLICWILLLRICALSHAG